MDEQQQAELKINDVKDEQNNTVPDGGNTESTALTLFGSAVPNSVVLIVDNDTVVGTASVTLNGTWEKSVTVALGEHRFTVRSTTGTVSPSWTVTVGEPQVLPAPVVVNAPDGSLNPVDAIQGVNIVVSYSSMVVTDLIGLSWNGRDNLAPPQNGSATGSVIFDLPASAVGAVLGQRIEVAYTVVRNGTPIQSEVLDLEVQSLPPSALQAPKIRQAPDDQNLDIGLLTHDADLYVPVWPFIAVGQQISLRFEGTHTNGSAYNWMHHTWQNFPITSVGEPATQVRLTDLRQLRNGSDLRVLFEVVFPEGGTRLVFPVRVFRVVSRPLIDISHMVLIGLAIHGLPGWTRTAYDSPGNVAYRPATGGTPPYTYFSSAPAVASVDSNGKVTGNANGSAQITVRDSAQRSASYPVSVSNVWRMVANDGPVTFTQAMAWVSQIGGRQITAADVYDFYVRHTKPFPLTKHHWLYGSPGYYVFFHYSTQAEHVTNDPAFPEIRAAWCVVPT